MLKRLEARGYAVRKLREGRLTRYFAAPPARSVIDLKVSPKGQVTLPKELRERLGVERGGNLRYTLQEDGRTFVDAPKKSLQDLFGMLHRPGMRAKTLEEIDEGIGKAVADEYLRGIDRRR